MNLQGVNIIIAFCFNTNLLLCNFAARFISRDQNSTILTEIKDYGQKKNDKKNNSRHAYDLHLFIQTLPYFLI